MRIMATDVIEYPSSGSARETPMEDIWGKAVSFLTPTEDTCADRYFLQTDLENLALDESPPNEPTPPNPGSVRHVPD